MKHFPHAVDHQRQLLRGFEVDRAVFQRVVAFALDADEKVARSGEREIERAGGIGLRFLGPGRSYGAHRDSRGADRRVILIHNATVQSDASRAKREAGQRDKDDQAQEHGLLDDCKSLRRPVDS